MLLWFVGTALAMVWFVFRDANFPFAAVAFGALLPDVLGLIPRAVAPTHSIVVVVAYLALAMAVTIGRRAVRKKLLAVAFGLFIHLVADFVFATDELFWWPLGGVSVQQTTIPTFERALAVNIGLEVLGAILLLWFLRRLAVAREVR